MRAVTITGIQTPLLLSVVDAMNRFHSSASLEGTILDIDL